MALLTIIGAIAIFSSAKIYMIPAIPAWNSVTTMFTFFLTSIILGPLFVGLLFSHSRGALHEYFRNFYFFFNYRSYRMILYFSSLQSGLPQAVEAARLTTHHYIFWIRLFTFVIAFAILSLSIKNKAMCNAKIYSFVFVLLFISEFLARFQFYETANHL